MWVLGYIFGLQGFLLSIPPGPPSRINNFIVYRQFIYFLCSAGRDCGADDADLLEDGTYSFRLNNKGEHCLALITLSESAIARWWWEPVQKIQKSQSTGTSAFLEELNQKELKEVFLKINVFRSLNGKISGTVVQIQHKADMNSNQIYFNQDPQHLNINGRRFFFSNVIQRNSVTRYI